MRLIQTGALAALSLVLMGAAPAPQPVWITAPTAEAMAAAYPSPALEAHAGGRVVLSCAVTSGGGLDPCEVLSQTPSDLGFGAAALSLAPTFHMRTKLSDGSPAVGLHFNIPIRFVLPEGAADVPLRAAVYPKSIKTYAGLGSAGPYYPERAERYGANGVAMIKCRAAANGVLSECVALSAKPADWGFDDAALMMARKHWLLAAPRLENGQPVDGEIVRIEVSFQMRR